MVDALGEADDAGEVARKGWRQCSIAPTELAEEVREQEKTEIGRDHLLVVASHDCDVTNGSFRSEPSVELLVARPTQAIDGNCSLGKNPRLLHLEVLEAGVLRPYEFAAGERLMTSRVRLLRHEPADTHTLAPEDVRLIARWMAKRYDRAAFPNAFNARWTPVRREIRKLLDRTGRYVSGLYLALPDDELPPRERYPVVVRGLIGVADAEGVARRLQAQECVDGLAGLLDGCDGIDVLDSALVREDEFTVDDLNRTKRWDWDWLSGADD